MRPMILLALAATTLAYAPAPALADDDTSGGEKVNAVIVYGDDKCPEPVGDEITICARKPERERFRIPQGLRTSPSTSSESWNSRVLAYERVGKTGSISCTPTGAGGWLGCSQRLIDQAYAEKAQPEDLKFSQILEQERAKRLATVDAEAAATQSRVEEVEKQQEARRRAEEEAAQATLTPAPAPAKDGTKQD